MNDFVRDVILAFIGSLVGGIMTAAGMVFKAGKRDGELATKDDLSRYLPRTEFVDFKADVNRGLERIEKAQADADQQAEARHAQIIDALLRGRER